jgi:hypothetical protein
MPAIADQQSTDYYIFEKLFWCRVPFNQSRSVDHIKHFGTPMSGDPDRDIQTANELVDRMLTISRMVEYWKGGTQVYVKNRNDTALIYEYISNHLGAWKKHLEHSLNVGDAPLQDLVDLDEFANVVHSHAKYTFTKEFVDDVLHRRLGSVLRVSRSQLFQPKVVEPALDTRTEEERLREQYPDRESMGSVFAQRLQSGSLNRGLLAKPTMTPGQMGLNPGSAQPNQGQSLNPGGSTQSVPGFAARWK